MTFRSLFKAGASYFGVKPDPIASRTGVTTWVDAGTAGAFSWPGFREFVVEASRARVLGFLNISSVGLVALTNEAEGPGLVLGATLGGKRAALLMQSSGVGNCINALGMVRECRFPLLMLVTMRGQVGEFNPWQVPMGQATPGALAAMGVVQSRHGSGTFIPAGPPMLGSEPLSFLAALHGFSYGGVFSFYQSGFDPALAAHSVGLVTMGLAIRAAFAEGLAEFDLHASAKHDAYRWGSPQERCFRRIKAGAGFGPST